ncbi:MAG: hypothetical protein WCE57_14595 [Salegentibacter sp.]
MAVEKAVKILSPWKHCVQEIGRKEHAAKNTGFPESLGSSGVVDNCSGDLLCISGEAEEQEKKAQFHSVVFVSTAFEKGRAGAKIPLFPGKGAKWLRKSRFSAFFLRKKTSATIG